MTAIFRAIQWQYVADRYGLLGAQIPLGILSDSGPRLKNHGISLRRIIPPWVPGMTATDPSSAFAETFDQPKLLHGKNEVLAAGRVEATSPSEPWADQVLVQLHSANGQQSGGLKQTIRKFSRWR